MGKARPHYLHSNLLLPFFQISALYLPNRSTGSLSLYGHKDGSDLTAVECVFTTGFECTSWLFIHIHITYKC